jgi:hypothetical protein
MGIGILVLIGGCAATPKGTTSYYFPKAETQILITQTLSCNAKADTLHEVVTVTPTTVYSSDLSVAPAKFTPSNLDGTFSDTDTGFTFTDDGRLSGLNVTTTGQGGTILKDVLGVVKAAGLVATGGPAPPFDATAACKIIADTAAKNKPVAGKDPKAAAPAAGADSLPTVTLTYAGLLKYGRTAAPDPDDKTVSLGIKGTSTDTPRSNLQILPDASSVSLVNSLHGHVPHLEFDVVIGTSTRYAAARWDGASTDAILLKLNSAALVDLTIMGPVGDLSSFDVVWKGAVAVPLTTDKDLFQLPIPKAALFGTHKFVLALSQYGSINKLEYSTSGSSDAADALGSLGSAVGGALKKPSASDQASAIQAQADLIYQQQRLVICQADPTKCPGK